MHLQVNHYNTKKKNLMPSLFISRNMYVRADRVMKLRNFLDRLTSVSGLMGEEKDPEEFLNSLNQIFKAEPFLKLR